MILFPSRSQSKQLPENLGRRQALKLIAKHSVQIAFLWSIVCLASPARAGSYDDFFKALQLDLAPTVEKLLIRGFDPNSVDPIRGDPALIYAVRNQAHKSLQVLLASPQIKIEAQAPNRDTALMIAAYKGDQYSVSTLLDKGAEPNRPGWTALHYSAAAGNTDIIRLLLDKYAYIDPEAPNKTTPLMMAAVGGHSEAMALLIEAGADQSLKNSLGMTARDFSQKFIDKAQPTSASP
jgi:ankyrin repeat protein